MDLDDTVRCMFYVRRPADNITNTATSHSGNTVCRTSISIAPRVIHTTLVRLVLPTSLGLNESTSLTLYSERANNAGKQSWPILGDHANKWPQNDLVFKHNLNYSVSKRCKGCNYSVSKGCTLLQIQLNSIQLWWLSAMLDQCMQLFLWCSQVLPLWSRNNICYFGHSNPLLIDWLIAYNVLMENIDQWWVH